MPRSKSTRLRGAQANGAVIKTKSDEPVTYASRHSRDDKPWVRPDGTRVAGTECEATVPDQT